MSNNYNLTRYERETIINFNDEESHCEICTFSPTQIRKLDKLCISNPNDYVFLKPFGDDGKLYKVSSKKLISYRTSREKKILTEDQKLLLSERMKKMHEARNK